MKKRCLMFVVPLFLIGCAGMRVQSRVTTFHTFNQLTGVTKYAFVPLKNQQNSLEWDAYKNQISAELSKYNFVEASAKDASILVAFDYAVGGAISKIGSMPIIGQTGVSSSSTTGTLTYTGNTGTYQQNTSYNPTYGVVGSRTFSYTNYPRLLLLYMVDKNSARQKNGVKYEAKVYSEGSFGEIAAVMPAMIKALFKEFPGKSGASRFVTLPINSSSQTKKTKK
ncbi:MAG: DUF4136 domain-containing protein [Deltaproteobacteria bacterium]|nr:DUF4136 domain-containing protein [Deltaproteobacteria bacterium]